MVAMAKKKTPITPKDGGEPAKKKRNVIFISLSDADEAALQALINTHRIKPDRSAVGYTALIELLKREGFDPAKYEKDE